MPGKEFKILIAPDSFKGTISAFDVSGILSEKLSKSYLPLKLCLVPLADGGEGSLEAINQTADFLPVWLNALNPQAKIRETFYLLDKKNKTAYIELAKASGLGLIQGTNDLMKATTIGTGQLMKHAIESGVSKIVLFLGGSATCDGGIGIAQALGARFYDLSGKLFMPLAENLVEISDFDVSSTVWSGKNIELLLAVDVNNLFFGPDGASLVYSPQKGAHPEQVRKLDEGLKNLARLFNQKMGIDLQQIPGSGAAGGTAGGLHAFFGAKISRGTDLIFKLLDLDEKIKTADLIISGEGKIDRQSLNHKLLSGISGLCTKYSKKLWAVCGYFDGDEQLLRELRIEKVFCLAGSKDEIEDSIKNPEKRLEKAADLLLDELVKIV